VQYNEETRCGQCIACLHRKWLCNAKSTAEGTWLPSGGSPETMSCAKSSPISERMYESYFRLVPLRHMLYVQHRDP
jgi:hypothetical protein